MNSKEKGNRFERYIAKLLSKELFGSDNLLFWRSASSGALGAVSHVDKLYGDIVSIDARGNKLTDKCVIELKSYKSLDLLTLFSSSSIFWKWWKQVLKEAEESKRIPVLIFKLNYRGIYFVFSYSDVKRFLNDFKFFRVICDYDVVIVQEKNGLKVLRALIEGYK